MLRRASIAVASLTLLAAAGTNLPAGAVLDDAPLTDHQCEPDDRREPGLQGDVPTSAQDSGDAELGYNCGLSLVAHAQLGNFGRTPTGNANMAWSGDCAYVSGGGAVFGRGTARADQGIAVVHVDPDTGVPAHVATLTSSGAALTSETLHAIDHLDSATGRERHLLVAAEYGNQSGGDKPMDVWDVTDCDAPHLLTTFTFPENVHNLTLSGDGRYVFGTQPLQVVDLDPLFDGNTPIDGAEATYLGNLEMAIDYPVLAAGPIADVDDAAPMVRRNGDACQNSSCYESHEAWPNVDGSRLVLGGQLPVFDVFTIVDIAGWLADPVDGTTTVLSQRQGRGHSVRTAFVDTDEGRREVAMHSEESVFGPTWGCLPEEGNPFIGPAEPFFTDITDPTDPQMHMSQFHLEINRAEHCAEMMESGVSASVHYHDFDDAEDATFAMLSMWNAGLRIVDVRDPEHPTEVAYFNPGDMQAGDGVALDHAWGHVRYVPETGRIWLATATGGFWTLELSPTLRSHLELEAQAPPVHDHGFPGRTGVDPIDEALLQFGSAAWYCTLGALTAPAS